MYVSSYPEVSQAHPEGRDGVSGGPLEGAALSTERIVQSWANSGL